MSSGSGVAVPALETAAEEAHRTDRMYFLLINWHGMTLKTDDTDLEVMIMPAVGWVRHRFFPSLQVAASDIKAYRYISQRGIGNAAIATRESE